MTVTEGVEVIIRGAARITISDTAGRQQGDRGPVRPPRGPPRFVGKAWTAGQTGQCRAVKDDGLRCRWTTAAHPRHRATPFRDGLCAFHWGWPERVAPEWSRARVLPRGS